MTQYQYSLRMNQSLKSGDCISSGNGYYGVLQNDGDFVLYKSRNWTPKNAFWYSNTANRGQGPYRLTVQTDGNVVIYDSIDTPIWSTNTYQCGPNVRFTLQQDGNLCAYKQNGGCIWSSHTWKAQNYYDNNQEQYQ